MWVQFKNAKTKRTQNTLFWIKGCDISINAFQIIIESLHGSPQNKIKRVTFESREHAEQNFLALQDKLSGAIDVVFEK